MNLDSAAQTLTRSASPASQPRRGGPEKPKYQFAGAPGDIFDQDKLLQALAQITGTGAWTARRNPHAAKHENVNYFELRPGKNRYDPYVKGLIKYLYRAGLAPDVYDKDSEKCTLSVKPAQIRDFILEQNAKVSAELNAAIKYAEGADQCGHCAHHAAKNYSSLQSLQFSGSVCQKKKDLGHIDTRVAPSAGCAFFIAKEQNQR